MDMHNGNGLTPAMEAHRLTLVMAEGIVLNHPNVMDGRRRDVMNGLARIRQELVWGSIGDTGIAYANGFNAGRFIGMAIGWAIGAVSACAGFTLVSLLLPHG